MTKAQTAATALAAAMIAMAVQGQADDTTAPVTTMEAAPEPAPVGEGGDPASESSEAPAVAGPEAAAELSTIPVQTPANTEPDGPASDASRSRMVEEIVVTAQKREENIQDVPVAVSAFSEEKLEAAGVSSTKDLQLVTPGLTISGSAGYNLIYLRGIGTSAFIPSFDPSVATYVDGVYIPSQQATLTDLGGVERVEILKGPQGTLFGRNSTGGAINVITKSPGSSLELSVDVEGASFDSENLDSRKAKVYVAFPLTDTLSLSVAGIYAKDDSFYKLTPDTESLTTPADYSLKPEITRGGRIKLRWQPTENLDFVLAGYRILQSGSLAFVEPVVDPSPLLGSIPLLAIHAPDDYETHSNTPPVSHSETTTVYASARWTLPWFDIKLLGSDQDQDSYDLSYDFDGGQPDIVAFTAPHSPSRLKTAELQFVSNDEGWTPDWLKWVGGLYYLNQKAGYDPFVAYVGATGLLPAGLNEALALVLPDFGFGPVGISSNGVLETNSYSGFLQSSVDLTDWFAVTLGGRYQEEDRFLIKQFVQATVLGSEPADVFQFNRPKRKQDNIAYRASLDFKPIDDLLVYLSHARSYKSGSYNIVTLYAPPDYVDPERATTDELGVKMTFIDGLTLNAALFNTKIKNLQETVLALQEGGAISAENAGSARSRGVEFDALWVPFLSWNDGFVVSASATYLDAIYTDYQNATGFNENTGLLFRNGDFSGNKIARTPEYSGTVSLSQTFDTHYGPVELAGDYYYNDGFNFSPQNAPSTEQDAYSLVNARLSYLYQPWKLRITAFGRNILDERYNATSLVIDFGTFQTLAPPRTYGLALGYEF